MALHDAETLRVGREGIARIRAQLAVEPTDTSPAPASLTRPATDVRDDAGGAGTEPTVDRMRLDMALASERERLLAAIRQKDAHIERLEATLAAVIRTAANGVDSTSAKLVVEPTDSA